MCSDETPTDLNGLQTLLHDFNGLQILLIILFQCIERFKILPLFVFNYAYQTFPNCDIIEGQIDKQIDRQINTDNLYPILTRKCPVGIDTYAA